MTKVRLIDANALMNSMCCLDGETQCDAEDCIRYKERKYIEAAPTIEAEPIRHGRWIVHTTWNRMFGLIHSECSECKFDRNGDLSSWKFCPNCGARMDGGSENG